MTELRLPELGENIETVDVSAVLVVVGDLIRRDQPVIEVETEKASLEVPADCAGRVAEVRVKEGDSIHVGEVIVVIETASGGGAVAPPNGSERDAPTPTSDDGGKDVAGRPSDEVTSRAAATRDPPAGPADKSPKLTAEPAIEFRPRPARREAEIGKTVPAAPSIRALARELGIEIREVRGSGAGGRISRDDVKTHAKRRIVAIDGPAAGPGHAKEDSALPDFRPWGETVREPLTRIRRATARNVAVAWNTVPHVTQFDSADVTSLERLRKDFNRRPEASGARLTLTAVVLKLTAAALKRFPKFNASLDVEADEAVYKKYIHIGVAVDTERGLLVPVVRDVDRKTLPAVSIELDDLAARARARRIKPDEMAGGSFTVSNLGGLGTTYFSPIVYWPEVAILGVGRADVQAVHREGRFEPRLVLPLSVSYDHRWIDGAEAARFLRWLAEALEQPLLLLLDGGGRREA